MKGVYKLTEDFQVVQYSGVCVRDINLTPDDRRLPDVAICRVYSSRGDAVLILAALRGGMAPGASLGSVSTPKKAASSAANGAKGGRPKKFKE